MTLSDETRTDIREVATHAVECFRGGILIDPKAILALLDEIDRLRAEVETARTAYRLTIRAMEGEIAENDGVIRTLRHQRDDAEAALDRVRALADRLDERGCLDCSSLTGGDTIAAEIRDTLEGAEQ